MRKHFSFLIGNHPLSPGRSDIMERLNTEFCFCPRGARPVFFWLAPLSDVLLGFMSANLNPTQEFWCQLCFGYDRILGS